MLKRYFLVCLIIFLSIIIFPKMRVRIQSLIYKQGVADTIVQIGGAAFKVEIADSAEKQAQGLSGRAALGQDSGMIFVFKDSDFHAFWMKDMKFPLDIVWINDKRIVGLSENLSPASYPEVYYPPAAVNMVLEINAGSVKSSGIQVGDQIQFLLK